MLIEAPEQLDEALDRATDGEDIRLTRGGRVVARIVALPPEDKQARVERLIRQMDEIASRSTLGPDLTIRDLIEEGRKY